MSVQRSETIGSRFQLKDESEQFGTFGGLLSRIFQHEMEHMEGELFIDSVSDFKLKSAMKKRKILKRKAERKQKDTTNNTQGTAKEKLRKFREFRSVRGS